MTQDYEAARTAALAEGRQKIEERLRAIEREDRKFDFQVNWERSAMRRVLLELLQSLQDKN
jgi:uncharacterized protein YutE (UPF0331/DUF86 family)